MLAAYQAHLLCSRFIPIHWQAFKDSTGTEYFTTLWTPKTNNIDTDNDNELRAMAIPILGHVAHIMYLWVNIDA